MDDTKSSPPRPTSLGIYDQPRSPGVTGIEITATIVSVLWLGGTAAFFLTRPDASGDGGPDVLRIAVTAMAVVLPVAMVWVAATSARAAVTVREECRRLQAALDAMRQVQTAQSQGGGAGADSAIAHRLEEIAGSTRKLERELAALGAGREDPAPEPKQPATATPAAPEEKQPALALGGAATDQSPPLPAAEFIRALNFPDSTEDREGFASLRRALKDRTAAQLIQAAQDVLTLLSQDGLYMDDLTPDRARPEIWRSFATGARGRAVSGLGGIRDRSALSLTAARMKRDPIFRDAAHHFLRKFDRTFATFEPDASDAEIAALTETRTARAFMLLGRVAGTFD